MLVEENFNIFNIIVREVLIYYGEEKKFYEISMTDAMRKHVKWTVRKIRNIIRNENLPPVKITEKCASCGYFWICQLLAFADL